MNNKPVAWMLKTGHGTKILEVKPYCQVDYWVPLYTHPVDLTDEEIIELWKKFENDETPIRSFARAILRKAQEK